jgi:hypothetical protein
MACASSSIDYGGVGVSKAKAALAKRGVVTR